MQMLNFPLFSVWSLVLNYTSAQFRDSLFPFLINKPQTLPRWQESNRKRLWGANRFLNIPLTNLPVFALNFFSCLGSISYPWFPSLLQVLQCQSDCSQAFPAADLEFCFLKSTQSVRNHPPIHSLSSCQHFSLLSCLPFSFKLMH
jgi:hypothetical protein